MKKIVNNGRVSQGQFDWKWGEAEGLVKSQKSKAASHRRSSLSLLPVPRHHGSEPVPERGSLMVPLSSAVRCSES
jgi:hypothetical protein